MLLSPCVCVARNANELASQGSAAETIAPLVIGIVLFIVGGINEMFTKRSAIVPPRLFKVSSQAS